MLQRLREPLTLLLLGLLPFHALLVTVGTKLISGSGHAPLTALALWKEALLGIILLIAFIEWLRTPSKPCRSRWAFDDIDLLIIGLVIFSIVITSLSHADWKLYAFGFKYDFIPLITFFALRRVVWSKTFFRKAMSVLVMVGAVIAAYAVDTLYLPERFFYWLGYSDLHSLYVPDQPLAAFQYLEGGGWRRVQSVMSGPNQLGLWLLIPFSISLVLVLRNTVATLLRCYVSRFIVLGLIVIGLFLTFSRSAWIGVAVIIVVAVVLTQSKDLVRRYVLNMFVAGVIALIIGVLIKPDVFLRLSSSKDHLTRPIEAAMTMWENPFGLGLGTAGPASNRVSDTCVHLKADDDPSWASDRPNLCVFLGDSQVQPPLIKDELRLAGQPTDRECKCPNLPENWYLQIGVEMGFAGLAAFALIILFILRKLRKNKEALPIFLGFLGISIAALFLHAWEDSAVALTVWILAAYVCSLSSAGSASTGSD
ncbi:O-antigen ligase family protein [Patescibacteria group bacterium]|nr:O-antigen ligase family protein [Patescibacteria group bacterium]MBU1123033.1 O-antigen ligase family protein [Patescibacteria group bacterium]